MHTGIREGAERFRATILTHTETQLTYDEAGVRWLDGYIIRHRETQKSNRHLHEAAGCFYGECIREVFGGQWQQEADTNQWMVVIEEGFSVYPFNKLVKHFENEDGDSILGLFTAIQPLLADARMQKARKLQALAPARPRTAPLPPASPWWKFW